jgi:hypothetical protein
MSEPKCSVPIIATIADVMVEQLATYHQCGIRGVLVGTAGHLEVAVPQPKCGDTDALRFILAGRVRACDRRRLGRSCSRGRPQLR